ncbi:hypothetical protein LJR220_003337 [Bradyrhizobium sp. LjRoot220]|uniref:hypothetical protein n=1 Tax=Bradyrhizobium sp. LjRoot220 TaxID=3342284 RepID=UPI003ECE0A03
MRSLKLSVFLLALIATAPAVAQTPNATGDTFVTQQRSKTVQGMVGMCVNSSNIAVPCGTGGTGAVVAGSTSNASSNVTPTATNVPTAAYQYCWDGSNWDQCPGLLTGTPGAPAADVLTVQFPLAGGSFPTGATAIQGNAAGTTGAVVGTLAANATKITYLCDFDVSGIGGTAALGPVTIAGLLGGSKIYQLSSSATGVTLSKSFNPCIPASAINTAITITTTANGTATAVNVNSSGYQQ